jgi:hypothetical protein
MATDWRAEHQLLTGAGIAFGPGLSEAELRNVERQVGANFPPDLRQFLSVGLPIGERFPNWREPNSPAIREQLDWPFEGIAFDIRANTFWLDDWGQRPDDVADAISVARSFVAAAPRLIPIFAHRYIPGTPCLSGNPVLSVYQTDIVHYGVDLANYLRAEFCPSAIDATTLLEPREIPLWTALAD